MKRDAAIHFGNVASSFSKKTGDPRSLGGSPFKMVCYTGKFSAIGKKYCPATMDSEGHTLLGPVPRQYAVTSPSIAKRFMALCDAFFYDIDAGDFDDILGDDLDDFGNLVVDYSKAREAVENSIEKYKKYYYSKTKNGSAPPFSGNPGELLQIKSSKVQR